MKLCSIAEAAIVTGQSVRTIERHIAAGKLETDRSSGRVRVRIEVPEGVEVSTRDVRDENDAETTLAARDAVQGVLAALGRSSERAERSRGRWTLAGTVAIVIGTAASAVAVMQSIQVAELRRTLSDTRVEAAEAGEGLTQALQDVATLRGDLAAATAVSDMADDRLRQADRHVATLLTRVDDLQAERDAIACDLADLRTAVLLDADTMTAMSVSP